MKRLENKVSIVTGGASGIGKAISILFAEEGSRVVVTDVNENEGLKVVEDIKQKDGEAIFIKHDVANEDEWERVIDQTLNQFGKWDVLVNNAGIGTLASIEEETLEQFRKIQSVNVESVFLGTKYAVLNMKTNASKCSIINVSSILGLVGESMAVAYNSSKGAIRLLTKSAALHCAKSGYNIRVNSIHPGYIRTPMVEDAIEDLTPIEALHPVGYLGDPMDIATGALYLASDESKFTTGSELVIDGGYTAQ